MLAVSNLTCLKREEPPPSLPPLGCDDLPVEAFLGNAAWNFLGVELSTLPPGASVDEDLLEAMGLGELAPKLVTLDAKVRAGTVDLALWPSLTGLSPGDAERTLVAAAILLDPQLELRCEYLKYLPEGPPRTVLEVALLVNESHGRPVPDSAVVDQPFEKKALTYEIACAARQALGLGPCRQGREAHDDHDDDDCRGGEERDHPREGRGGKDRGAGGRGRGEHHRGDGDDRPGDHGDRDRAVSAEDHEPPCSAGAERDPAGPAFDPTTVLDSPVVQLYAAFRGAHRAQWRGDPPAQVDGQGGHRPWAYRPFGRSQARLDSGVEDRPLDIEPDDCCDPAYCSPASCSVTMGGVMMSVCDPGTGSHAHPTVDAGLRDDLEVPGYNAGATVREGAFISFDWADPGRQHADPVNGSSNPDADDRD